MKIKISNGNATLLEGLSEDEINKEKSEDSEIKEFFMRYPNYIFTHSSWRGWSILEYIIYNEHFEFAIELIKNGANTDQIFINGMSQGWSLLEHSLYYKHHPLYVHMTGYSKLAKEILLSNPDPTQVIRNGSWKNWSFLEIAIYEGYSDSATIMLKKAPVNCNQPFAQDKSKKQSLFNYALSCRDNLLLIHLRKSYEAIIAAMLEHDDPSRIIEGGNWHGWSTLAFAVHEGYIETAPILIQKGADPQQTFINGPEKGWLLLEYALHHKDDLLSFTKTGYQELAKTILEIITTPSQIIDKGKWKGWSLVALSINEKYFDIAIKLITRGRLDCNQTFPGGNSRGWSLLAYAVYYGYDEEYIELVNILLQYRANPNQMMQGKWNEWSVLAYAVYYGYDGIVKTLLEYGANRNQQIKSDKWKGYTLLNYAIKMQYDAIATLLISDIEEKKPFQPNSTKYDTLTLLNLDGTLAPTTPIGRLNQTIIKLDETFEKLESTLIDSTKLEEILAKERQEIGKLMLDKQEILEQELEKRKNEIEKIIQDLQARITDTANTENKNKLEQDLNIEQVRLTILAIEKQLESVVQNQIAKVEKEEARVYFKPDDNLWYFYQAVQTFLGRLFIPCYAGTFKNKAAERIAWAQLGIELGSDIIGIIPGINSIVGVLSLLSKWGAKFTELGNQKKLDKTNDDVSSIITLHDLSKETEYFARQLTYWYERQIKDLAIPAQDVRKFSEVITTLAIDSILNHEINDKESLSTQLVHIITTKKSAPEQPLNNLSKLSSKLLKVVVLTKSQASWNVYDLYTKSGIITKTNEIYTPDGKASPFPVCNGTKEAADARGLKYFKTRTTNTTSSNSNTMTTQPPKNKPQYPIPKTTLEEVHDGVITIGNDFKILKSDIKTKQTDTEQKVSKLENENNALKTQLSKVEKELTEQKKESQEIKEFLKQQQQTLANMANQQQSTKIPTKTKQNNGNDPDPGQTSPQSFSI